MTVNAAQITAGHALPDQPVVLGFLGTSPEWNGVWQLTSDGRIINPYYPNLVIGVLNGEHTCVVNRDNTDDTQIWNIVAAQNSNNNFTITNKVTGMYWTAPSPQYIGYDGGQDEYSAAITLEAALGNDGQNWIFLPAAKMPGNSFYLISAMEGEGKPGEGKSPYAISSATTGTITNNIYLENWQPGLPAQLWSFRPDGSIVQSTDVHNYNPLVLTATGNTSSTDVAAIFWSPLNSTPAPTNQSWIYKNEMLALIDNSVSVNANSFQTGSDVPLLAWPITPGQTNSEWYIFPEQSVLTNSWFYLKTLTGETPADSTYVLTAAGDIAGSAVVIDEQQPDALNQLWCITVDGNIVNAAAPSLFLSAVAGESSCLKALGASGCTQNWYITPNGMLISGTSTNLQYLNVQSALKTLDGGEVLTVGWGGSSPLWEPIVYEPFPLGQWFTISCAIAVPGVPETPYLLTANDDWQTVTATPPLGGYQVPDGIAAISQLWRFNLNGTLISAVNPNLSLSANGTGAALVLQPLQSANPNQQWEWGYSQRNTLGKTGRQYGILQNLGFPGQNAGICFNSANAEVTLQVQSGVADIETTLWAVAAFAPAFNRSTTINNLGEGEGGSLFLSILGLTERVSVGERGADPATSTWEFVYPGYIVSAANEEIVLGIGVNQDQSSLSQPQFTDEVVPYLKQPGYQPFQLWSMTQEGLIINKLTGKALTVTTSESDTKVCLTELNRKDSSLSQLWDFSPGFALQNLIVQPITGYPQGGSGSDFNIIYEYISQQLGLSNGIRTQYYNLSAPLSSYQIQLNVLTIPDTGISPEDWTITLAQINKELTAACAVQSLFQQITNFHADLTQAQSIALSEAITAAALPDLSQTKIKPKKKHKWITDLVEGVVYTALNFAGDMMTADADAPAMKKIVKHGLPAVANLFETGLNTAMDGFGGNSSNQQTSKNLIKLQSFLNNVYNYELSVLQLQQTLLSIFNATGSALGQIESIILRDWEKLQAFYKMIIDTGRLSSLFWPSTMGPMEVGQMLSEYRLGVLQTLMPANTTFKVTAKMFTNFARSQPAGLQNNGLTFIENNADRTQNIYTTTANQQVMDMLWANGENPVNFFRNLNGWALPYIYQVSVAPGLAPLSELTAAVIVTIHNFTDQSLTLILTLNSLIGSRESFQSNTSTSLTERSLEPYGVQHFAGACWQYEVPNGGPSNWRYITTALQGNVEITKNHEVISTLYVNNSYNSNGNSNDPATYEWTIITQNAAYEVSIKQEPANSGMCLHNIFISVAES